MLDDTTLDLLKFESFPDLATAVRKRSHEVLGRWQAVVKQRLPGADALTIAQIRNAIPNVLAQMAETLESEDPARIDDLKEASAMHGEMRFHQSYNLDEVLIEYGLLRPILIEEICEHLSRDLDHDELAVVNMGVDTAMRRSATQFAAYQANKLQAANDAHSKYLSFLSHDLRVGLNGILLTSEVLTHELTGQAKHADSLRELDVMRRSIMDTVATMDRFLHAERFRQGAVKPVETEVDIRALIDDLGVTFGQQAKAKGINLRFAAPIGVTACTDRELLSLILMNLIGNAIKYTAAGQVSVTAETSCNDGIVRISVVDSGPGIESAQLARMFDTFTRGETHGQPGSGLGLSIARQAAELIGAKLTAKSTPGVGSTFIVELHRT